MGKAYKSAPDADRVAAHLISNVHDHLKQYPIRCVFQDEPDKDHGRSRLASIRKLTGLVSFLAGAPSLSGGLQESLDLDLPITYVEPEEMLLISVWEGGWNGLRDSQKLALIDHELCHARVKEDEKGNVVLMMVGHDIEEFYAVAERNGDWLGELALLTNAVGV